MADRNHERASRAAADLAACAVWAAARGQQLVIENNVTRHFAFSPEDFPTGTLDRRDGDAVREALDDRDSLLVTAGGYHWGTPVTSHPQWSEFLRRRRPWAALTVSALSGSYHGIHLQGEDRERFVDGHLVTALRREAELELADGTTAQITRTTVGFEIAIEGERHFRRDFAEALGAIAGSVVRVDAPGHTNAALAQAIEAAGLLPDHTVTINGTTWTRRPALHESS
jgi:hypothetical protein